MLSIFDATEEDIELSKNTLNNMGAIYKLDDNVHNHSKYLGAECQKFLTLDNRYQISGPSKVNFENVCQQITDVSNNDQIIVQVLTTIKNFGNGVESETSLNIKDLLIRTWDLTDHYLVAANMKELVIDNLKHNILTGGGCLAGISARLTQPYCNCINWILLEVKKIKEETIVNLNPAVIFSNKQEEDYQLGLAMSLSQKEFENDQKTKKLKRSAEEITEEAEQPATKKLKI